MLTGLNVPIITASLPFSVPLSCLQLPGFQYPTREEQWLHRMRVSSEKPCCQRQWNHPMLPKSPQPLPLPLSYHYLLEFTIEINRIQLQPNLPARALTSILTRLCTLIIASNSLSPASSISCKYGSGSFLLLILIQSFISSLM